MRKLAIYIGIIFLISSSIVHAAGTVVVTTETMPNNMDVRTITFTWTADAAAATVPSTTLTADQIAYVQGFHCYLAITDPGATAPTADYDIVINDTLSCDVFGGELADRSATTSEQCSPAVGSAYGGRTCLGAWTFVLTNNSVNSATGVLVLCFSR